MDRLRPAVPRGHDRLGPSPRLRDEGPRGNTAARPPPGGVSAVSSRTLRPSSLVREFLRPDRLASGVRGNVFLHGFWRSGLRRPPQEKKRDSRPQPREDFAVALANCRWLERPQSCGAGRPHLAGARTGNCLGARLPRGSLLSSSRWLSLRRLDACLAGPALLPPSLLPQLLAGESRLAPLRRFRAYLSAVSALLEHAGAGPAMNDEAFVPRGQYHAAGLGMMQCRTH